MPTDSFWKSCITECTFVKVEHQKEIAQEYIRKKSNASSIISQTEEEASRAESYNFSEVDSIDIDKMIGTSVNSDDQLANLKLNSEWFM